MYYYRVCAIARRAGIHDTATITYLRNGLNHNGLRNVIAGMNFNTCLELYAFLCRYEANNSNRTDNVRNTYHTPFTRNSLPSADPVDRKPNERRDIRCFNCNEHGHISINCPKAYASPIVLVKKRNGEDRLCVDYRQFNAITIKQPYPMPLVEEQLAVLAGNTIFTSLDLVAGYHQILIAESSKLYTAFVTNDGHYEFNRMPFGLVNAPSVFQTVINGIVQKLDRGEAIAYLDDIILPSKNIKERIALLRKFLTVLRTTGLTLRLSKCKFLAEEVTFLDHRISKDGMIPGNEKTAQYGCFRSQETYTSYVNF